MRGGREREKEEVTKRFPVRAIPHFRSPQLISSIPASCYARRCCPRRPGRGKGAPSVVHAYIPTMHSVVIVHARTSSPTALRDADMSAETASICLSVLCIYVLTAPPTPLPPEAPASSHPTRVDEAATKLISSDGYYFRLCD